MRTVKSCLVSGVVVWILIAGATSPATAQPLADRVPSDAQVYLGWAGAESLGPEFEGSNLQGLLKAVDLPELWNQIAGMIQNLAGQELPQGPETIDLGSEVLGNLWRHPTAFYFMGLENADGGAPKPRVALLCNIGPGATPLRDKIRAAMRQPAARGFEVEAIDGLLILAYGLKPADIAKPASPLSADARFKEAMALVHRPSVAALYMDTPAVAKTIDSLVEREVSPGNLETYRKALEALGLNGLGRIAATAGFAGKDWRTAAFVEAPAPRKGLLKVLESKPIDESSFKLIPATASWFAAGRFDPSAAWDALRQSAREIDPRSDGAIDQVLAMGQQVLGFDPVEGLIRSMGDEWVAYSDVSLAGAVLVHKLRDPQKFDQSLTAIENIAQQLLAAQAPQVPLHIQRIRSGDMTVRTLNLFIFALSWSVHDGRLLAGMYPQSLFAAADNIRTAPPSIADRPEFRELRKSIAHEKLSGISYTDLQATAPQVYQLLMVGVQLVQGLNREPPGQDQPLILAPLGRLMPLFRPAMQATWVDEKGFHLVDQSPFPGATALSPSALGSVAGASLAAGILLPSLGRARELANRTVAGTRLGQIHSALETYAIEHKDKYPPDLGTLVKEHSIPPQALINPRTRVKSAPPRSASPDQLAQWANEHSDFVYRAGKVGPNSPDQEIVLYERIVPGLREGISICFANGSVRFVLWDEARDLLRQAGEIVPDELPQAPSTPLGGLIGQLP